MFIADVLPFVFAFLPLVLGFGTACLTDGVDAEAGAVVLARPPARAFTVLWIALYILIGASWGITFHSIDATLQWLVVCIFGFLVASLSAWLVVYPRAKHQGAWVITLALAATLACLCLAQHAALLAALLLSPLVAWLVFALLLNVIEVQHQVAAAQPNL